MDRAIPIFNHYLSQKWQTHSRKEHRLRIQNIQNSQGSIPAQNEPKYKAMKNIYTLHSRKQQLQSDRSLEINKRNQQLYKRMSVIFKTERSFISDYQSYQQLCRVGSRNPDFGNVAGNNLVINRKSLRVESNRQNQKQISCENLQFLRKLQSLKPTYSTSDYIQQHKRRGLLVERISKYPLILDHNCTQSILQKPLARLSETRTNLSKTFFNQRTQTAPMQIPSLNFAALNQYHALPEGRLVRYKKGHHIEPKGFFVVEISTLGSQLFIAALSTYNSECYALRISNRSVIKSLGSDFGVIASCLCFRGDKLVYKRPKQVYRTFVDRDETDTANICVPTDQTNLKEKPLNLNSDRSKGKAERQNPESLFDVPRNESSKTDQINAGGMLTDEDFGDDEVERISGEKISQETPPERS